MCDDGVLALSETLRTNNTITELDLGSKLNHAIINSIIHTLFFFSVNLIRDRGVTALCEMFLTNTALTSLSMESLFITK